MNFGVEQPPMALRIKCIKLFNECEEFHSPYALRAFASVTELGLVVECIPRGETLDYNRLIFNLLRNTNRTSSEPALFYLLDALAIQYRQDIRGEQFKELKAELRGALFYQETSYLQLVEDIALSKGGKHDVFICHSFVDKKFARRIANDLTIKGFKVWFDEFEMLPGDSLFEKIQAGIRNSTWFIIVLSPDSVESKWCKRELHNAMEVEFERSKVYVVPVLYRRCEIPGFLKEKLWADCEGRSYTRGLKEILRRLAK
jgi:hypothetical protein